MYIKDIRPCCFNQIPIKILQIYLLNFWGDEFLFRSKRVNATNVASMKKGDKGWDRLEDLSEIAWVSSTRPCDPRLSFPVPSFCNRDDAPMSLWKSGSI